MDEDGFISSVADSKGEVPALFIGQPFLVYLCSYSRFRANIKISVKLRNRVLHPVEQVGGFIAVRFSDKPQINPIYWPWIVNEHVKLTHFGG